MSQILIDFTVLQSTHAAQSLRVYPLPDGATPFGDILLALGPEGHRRVMIPLQDGARVKVDRASAGVHILRESHSWDGRIRTYIVIQCVLAHLNDVFHLIAADMVDAVLPAPSNAAQTVHFVLEKWRQLIASPRRELMSDEKLTGLWGELWHLRRLVENESGALATWTGWDATAHDFRSPACDLEVKTTRSRTWKLAISSIDQLERGDGELVLSVLRVERGGTSGESVTSLIDAILAAGVDRPSFITALDGAGFAWEHRTRPEVADLRFTLRDRRAWFVRDDFPRIVRSSLREGDLPAGVVALQYNLELSSFADDAMREEELESVLITIAGSACET